MVPPVSLPENVQRLRVAMQIALDQGKNCFVGFILAQVTLGVLGIGAVFWAPLSQFIAYPVVIVLIAFVTLFLQARMITGVEAAESMKRLTDRFDHFGILPEDSVVASALQDFGESLTLRQKRDLEDGRTFTSSEKPGAKRALENLRESAFYTSDQAGFSAKFLYCVAAFIGVGTLMIVLVILPQMDSVQKANGARVDRPENSGSPAPPEVQHPVAPANPVATSNNTPTGPDSTEKKGEGEKAAESLGAVIALVVSSGILLTAWQYQRLSKRAKESHLAAEETLRNNRTTDDIATFLWSEYQMVRASSPPTLTLVWRFRRQGNEGAYRAFLAKNNGQKSGVVEATIPSISSGNAAS